MLNNFLARVNISSKYARTKSYRLTILHQDAYVVLEIRQINMAASGDLVAEAMLEDQISTCTSPHLMVEIFIFGSINLFFQVSPCTTDFLERFVKLSIFYSGHLTLYRQG